MGSKTDHEGKRRSTPRKTVSVAEDAARRNMELEIELRDRNRELEMHKEVDREHCRQINELRSTNRGHCRQINELRSANQELSSIIRHALEDMRRENVDLTNALHDRIEGHAPSALSVYFTENGPSMSSALDPEAQRQQWDAPVYNIANPPLPQLSSGEWSHSAQTQPPWMNVDQNMTDLDSFEPQFWNNFINYPRVDQ